MIIKIFEGVLVDFINKFITNPFYYFYEEDLRCSLISNLADSFKEIKFNVKPDFVTKLKNITIYSTPIKCEYPHSGKNHNRFDIAFIESISEDFYNCEVRIGVEIKFGSPIYKRKSGFIKDIDKLKKKFSESLVNQFLGIGLYFYQGAITIDDIKKWFPETTIEVIEKHLNKLKKINLPSNGIKILVISSNNVFSLRI